MQEQLERSLRICPCTLRTAFGEAFFSHGLNTTQKLTEAFKATVEVAALEKSLKIVPSEPQIYVGDDLRRRFATLVGQATTARQLTERVKRACFPSSLTDACVQGALR